MRIEMERTRRAENLRREQRELMQERIFAIRSRWPDLRDVQRQEQERQAFKQTMLTDAKRRREMVFSPPPIPGTEDIIPLTKGIDMIEEGLQQANCSSRYIDTVKTGLLYFYRVMAPERATLSICQFAGVWQRRELRGRCNTNVRKSTANAVDRWLRDYQHSV